eukprot:1374759-Rhodomonas_salina.1
MYVTVVLLVLTRGTAGTDAWYRGTKTDTRNTYWRRLSQGAEKVPLLCSYCTLLGFNDIGVWDTRPAYSAAEPHYAHPRGPGTCRVRRPSPSSTDAATSFFFCTGSMVLTLSCATAMLFRCCYGVSGTDRAYANTTRRRARTLGARARTWTWYGPTRI